MKIGAWAKRLKVDVVALWIAARDPRTPLLAKLVGGAVAAYALSPIDLIPDFIPLLGYLDDLIIVPAGIWLALQLIPSDLMTEFRTSAKMLATKPVSRVAVAVIVLLWIGSAIAAAYWWAGL